MPSPAGPPAGPPPEGGDQDRGPYFVAILWVLGAADILFVAGRFWGRRMIRSTGWDDWTMLLTLVLFLVHNSILSYDALHGGQRHLFYMSPEQISEALRYNWLAQPYMIMGFWTGKLSVGLLLLRLIGPHTVWRKWMIYFAMASSFLFTALNIIFTYVQCDKVEALWEPQLVNEGIAHCWPPQIQTNFAIFLGCWNAIIDALLAILPITLVWGLQMSVRQKLALGLLLGLGMIAAVCAAVKTQYLATLNKRSDLTWMTYDLFVWSVAELFVIIACGSVPPMKPIWDRFFGKAKSKVAQYGNGTKVYTSNSGGGGYGGGYGVVSKVAANGSFGRKHSHGSAFNESRGLTKNAGQFDLESYPHGTREISDAELHKNAITKEIHSRVEVWQREGAFPVGTQPQNPENRPQISRPL